MLAFKQMSLLSHFLVITDLSLGQLFSTWVAQLAPPVEREKKYLVPTPTESDSIVLNAV